MQLYIRCVVLSPVLTASKMATKVKIRVDPTCKATKSDLLAICATNEVKIVKIFERPEEYVVLCSTLDDSEKLLSPRVIRAMSACNLTPVLPFALRAQRSLLVFHLDSLIFDHSTQEIKDEIQERNPWATVTEVIKLSSNNSIKVIFSSYSVTEKVLELGLSLFLLHVPGINFKRDRAEEILTCFRCYALNSHVASKCNKDPSYKVCSTCASPGHTFKNCTSTTKKCINCKGDHHTMSRNVPLP